MPDDRDHRAQTADEEWEAYEARSARWKEAKAAAAKAEKQWAELQRYESGTLRVAKIATQAGRARFELAVIAAQEVDALLPALERAFADDDPHIQSDVAWALTVIIKDYLRAASDATRAAEAATDALMAYHEVMHGYPDTT